MSNSFDYFDKIYCINLPEDYERKDVMNKAYEKLGIKDRIIWCSSPRPQQGYECSSYYFPGEFGVVLSQLKAITHSLNFNIKNGIAIFEDDIYFDDNSNQYLKEALDNVPDDWDILYLGGRPLDKLVHVRGNIYKVGKFTSAMSYCISKKALYKYTQFYIDRMGRAHPDACCDNILNDFITVRGMNGYVVYPTLTSTIPGWSTLRQADRDYREIINESWKECL